MRNSNEENSNDLFIHNDSDFDSDIFDVSALKRIQEYKEYIEEHRKHGIFIDKKHENMIKEIKNQKDNNTREK